MSRRLAILCLSTALVAVPLWAQAQTLAEAIAMGIERNAGVSRANSAVDLAYEERNGTAAQSRMRVQVDGQAGRRQEAFQSQSFFGGVSQNRDVRDQQSVGLTISQPIYTGGRVREALNRATSLIASAEVRAAGTEIQASRNAAAAYAELLRAQTITSITTASLALSSENVRAARARKRAGEVSLTDVAQSEARLASAEALVAQASGDELGARATFERFVGMAATNLDPNLPMPALPATMMDYLDAVSVDNLSITAAREDYNASLASVRVASVQRNPRVSLDARYQQSWGENFPNQKSQAAEVNAVLTMPLWDGGQTSSNVRQAIARSNSARYALRDIQDDVRATAMRTWADYMSSLQIVKAAERQVEAAQLARRGAQAELRFGLRSTIEALNQEQELRSAQVSLANARRDSYIHLIDLMSLMGRNPLGQRARSLDPVRRSAVPPPRIPRALPVERPLTTVLEFLEGRDKAVSQAMYSLNTALQPRLPMGPMP
jgi:outer membrane protein